jgi:ligand-binding SRPBCC domain-containing protein
MVAFHELPDALQRLTPPGEQVRVIQAAESLKVGAAAIVEMKMLGLFPVRWVAKHTVYDPPRMFEDIQISGPFRAWRHKHLIIPHPDGAILRDEVEYEPPLGIAGALLAPVLIVPRLHKLFDYRHSVTRAWCERDSY